MLLQLPKNAADAVPTKCLRALKRAEALPVKILRDLVERQILTSQFFNTVDQAIVVRQLMIPEDRPQQLMSAAALLTANKNPADADIDAAMVGNICRCGTYDRIRAAIKTAATSLRKTT